MPLVFVHGVSNRDTPEFRENQLARDALLREHVVRRLGSDALNVAVLNPYWGNHGAIFRWGHASLPESFDSMETFGTGLDPKDLRIAADSAASLGPGAADIVSIARSSLSDAIDVVWGAALSAAETADLAAALAESNGMAFDYAAANPAPKWLATAGNDNFVDLLLYHIRRYRRRFVAPAKDKVRWERLGAAPLLDNLKEGLSRFSELVGSAKSATISLGRKKAHLGTSMFLGDVFEYLTKRGERDDPRPIVTTVLDAFRTAGRQLRVDDPKLIIVAHSLGGVISYDILTYFDPTLEVDVFVTVGSQVALFEEMGLYKHVLPPANTPADRLERPANIKRWMNVLDPNDVFSFRAEGVYVGVTDFKYDTGYGLIQAHSGYFYRPNFYQRVGERLAESPP